MTRFRPVPFGNYVLLERIGADATGESYRAARAGEPEGKGVVLVKKFLSQRGADESSLRHLQEAAEISRSLHHPNILKVQDVGFVEDVFYIATEYLPGRTLEEVMRASKGLRRPLDLGHALHIAMSLCRGLHHAHTQEKGHEIPDGMLHAAICPEKIWITFSGEVKIALFGMEHAESTNKGVPPGMFQRKFAYMSPEQADGRPADRRCDIFATGILLYEMVTGKPLFRGGIQEVFSDVRQARFVPPEKVNPDLPSSLCRVIQKALQRDPENRYLTAEEMLTALRDVDSEIPSRPLNAGLGKHMEALFDRDRSERAMSPEAHRADSVRQNAPHHEEPLGAVESTRPHVPKRADLPASDIRPNIPQPDQPRSQTAVCVPHSTGGRPGRLTRRTAVLIAAGLAGVVFLAGLVTWFTKRPATAVQIKVETALNALKAGQFEQAVMLFDQAVAAEPAMLERLAKPYAEALEGQALEFAKTDLDKAKDLLETALKFDPKRLSTLSQLGLLYLRCNEYDQAAQCYERAARLDAHHPDVFFNLGYIYALSEDFEKAEKMYGRVVALNPPFRDEALFNLAVVQERMGKRRECIRNLKLALKANPNNKPARQYLKRIKG